MRTIKFRAWNKKEMYYFDLRSIFKTGYLVGKSKIEVQDEGKLKDIVMQYTGLKDKKGKEIYEGDIVKDWKKTTKQVKFKSGSFINYLDNDFDEPTTTDCKIIGNIYENEDL